MSKELCTHTGGFYMLGKRVGRNAARGADRLVGEGCIDYDNRLYACNVMEVWVRGNYVRRMEGSL